MTRPSLPPASCHSAATRPPLGVCILNDRGEFRELRNVDCRVNRPSSVAELPADPPVAPNPPGCMIGIGLRVHWGIRLQDALRNSYPPTVADGRWPLRPLARFSFCLKVYPMARRLSVVISQSPTSNPSRRHLEEEIVTRLLMEAGVEVNVVPHLADLPTDATGMLCLEGIPGDMVLLSWLSDAQAWSYLASYGILGRRGVTRLPVTRLAETNGHDLPDAGMSQPSPARPSERAETRGDPALARSRSIYLLNLGDSESADPLLDEIRRIREDRSVQTFQLSGLGSSPLAVVASPTPPTSNGRPASPAELSRQGPAASPVAQNPTVSAAGSPQMPVASGPARAASTTPPGSRSAQQPGQPGDPDLAVSGQEVDAEDAELDRLVDQLDEFDK
jgi:hypothetical protein